MCLGVFLFDWRMFLSWWFLLLVLYCVSVLLVVLVFGLNELMLLGALISALMGVLYYLVRSVSVFV